MFRLRDDGHLSSGLRWLSGCLLALSCALAPAQPKDAIDLAPEQRARLQWEAGYVLHMMGDYERAIELYRHSIEAKPTAEAHTYLGWALSHIGRIEEAIAQCEIAIRIDPDFGNPYNDIGVYLMALGRADEAAPWFEKAIAARRYCCYQFAHANLGRVLLAQGRVEDARLSFENALKHDPAYEPALIGLELIRQLGLRGL